jgi:hypothetical protein
MAEDVEAFRDEVADLVTPRFRAVDTQPTQFVRLTAVPQVLSAPKPMTVLIPEYVAMIAPYDSFTFLTFNKMRGLTIRPVVSLTVAETV